MTSWFMARRTSLAWLASVGLAAAFLAPPIASAATIVRQRTEPATGIGCAIQLSVANPNIGDTNLPRSLVMTGSALDRTAIDGSGIAQVQAFLGDRDEGGQVLGTATFTGGVGVPLGSWTLTTTFPGDANGGETIFVYALSSKTGQEASVAIPVILGQSAATASFPKPTTAAVACPAVVLPGNGTPPSVAGSPSGG